MRFFNDIAADEVSISKPLPSCLTKDPYFFRVYLFFELGAALNRDCAAINREQVPTFGSDCDELGVEVPDATEVHQSMIT